MHAPTPNYGSINSDESPNLSANSKQAKRMEMMKKVDALLNDPEFASRSRSQSQMQSKNPSPANASFSEEVKGKNLSLELPTYATKANSRRSSPIVHEDFVEMEKISSQKPTPISNETQRNEGNSPISISPIQNVAEISIFKSGTPAALKAPEPSVALSAHSITAPAPSVNCEREKSPSVQAFTMLTDLKRKLESVTRTLKFSNSSQRENSPEIRVPEPSVALSEHSIAAPAPSAQLSHGSSIAGPEPSISSTILDNISRISHEREIIFSGVKSEIKARYSIKGEEITTVERNLFGCFKSSEREGSYKTQSSNASPMGMRSLNFSNNLPTNIMVTKQVHLDEDLKSQYLEMLLECEDRADPIRFVLFLGGVENSFDVFVLNEMPENMKEQGLNPHYNFVSSATISQEKIAKMLSALESYCLNLSAKTQTAKNAKLILNCIASQLLALNNIQSTKELSTLMVREGNSLVFKNTVLSDKNNKDFWKLQPKDMFAFQVLENNEFAIAASPILHPSLYTQFLEIIMTNINSEDVSHFTSLAFEAIKNTNSNLELAVYSKEPVVKYRYSQDKKQFHIMINNGIDIEHFFGNTESNTDRRFGKTYDADLDYQNELFEKMMSYVDANELLLPEHKALLVRMGYLQKEKSCLTCSIM